MGWRGPVRQAAMPGSDYICPECLAGDCDDDPQACTSRNCGCCGTAR